MTKEPAAKRGTGLHRSSRWLRRHSFLSRQWHCESSLSYPVGCSWTNQTSNKHFEIITGKLRKHIILQEDEVVSYYCFVQKTRSQYQGVELSDLMRCFCLCFRAQFRNRDDGEVRLRGDTSAVREGTARVWSLHKRVPLFRPAWDGGCADVPNVRPAHTRRGRPKTKSRNCNKVGSDPLRCASLLQA